VKTPYVADVKVSDQVVGDGDKKEILALGCCGLADASAVVEVITLVVQWTRDGAAYFVRDDLPIVESL
jgi:hypothetical protein